MFKNNKRFILLYLMVFASGLVLLLLYGRDDIQLFVNRNFTGRTSDLIFGRITHLGNGFSAAIVVLVLLVFCSYRKAILLGSAAIATAIVVQTMKHLIYSHLDRPIKYFHDMGIQDLHWPIGTNVHFTYSFPSGHTATVFVVLFFLIFSTRNPLLKYIFFIISIIVGYSRIHLSQHFLTDVLAGSLIGFILASLAAWWYLKKGDPRLEKSLLSELGYRK